MFETTGMNVSAGAYTRDKFLNFRVGVRKPKKLPTEAVFWVGACYQRTAQTAQFRVTGIISGASRHPKDVPFVHTFWWGCTAK